MTVSGTRRLRERCQLSGLTPDDVVDRSLSIHRRDTLEIAALFGMTEAEVWNTRARMDAQRERR